MQRGHQVLVGGLGVGPDDLEEQPDLVEDSLILVRVRTSEGRADTHRHETTPSR